MDNGHHDNWTKSISSINEKGKGQHSHRNGLIRFWSIWHLILYNDRKYNTSPSICLSSDWGKPSGPSAKCCVTWHKLAANAASDGPISVQISQHIVNNKQFPMLLFQYKNVITDTWLFLCKTMITDTLSAPALSETATILGGNYTMLLMWTATSRPQTVTSDKQVCTHWIPNLWQYNSLIMVLIEC